MNERATHWLGRADRALVAAARDLDAGDAESTADHAYYAMFYVASACLEQEGLRFRRHRHHRWLLDAFDLRTTATYDVERVIDREGAATALERAHAFREAVARFLAETL